MTVDGVPHPPGLRPVGRHVLHLQHHNQSPSDWALLLSTHHVRLLSEGPAAHLAHEGLLPGVDLEVAVQQRLAHEPLAAAGPGAGVALAVHLLG